MDAKKTAVVSYITWIGFLIAYFIGDKTSAFARQHMNQALIINLAAIAGSFIANIPVFGKAVGGVISLAAFVFWIMGLMRAIKESDEPLPIIGDYEIIK